MKNQTKFYMLVLELPALIVAGIFLGQYLDHLGWTGGAGSALCIVLAFFGWMGHLVVAVRKNKDETSS